MSVYELRKVPERLFVDLVKKKSIVMLSREIVHFFVNKNRTQTDNLYKIIVLDRTLDFVLSLLVCSG